MTTPQYDRRGPERRVTEDRRFTDERRATNRRADAERRLVPDRRASTEPPAEHLRNAMQLLSQLSGNGRLRYDDRLELDAARRRLQLALLGLERRPTP